MNKNIIVKSTKLMAMMFLFLTIFSASCVSDNANHVEFWKVSSAPNFRLYPIAHKNLVILACDCNGERCLKAVNKFTGKLVWSWIEDEILSESYYNFEPYIYSNLLILPIKSKLIAIDLNNGTTKWENNKDYPGEPFLDGLGESVVRTYYSLKENKHIIFLIDIYSGHMQAIKEYSLSLDGTNFVRTPHIYKLGKESKDTSLVSSIIEYVPNKSTISYLSFATLSNPSLEHNTNIYQENKQGYGVTKQCISDGKKSFWVAHHDLVYIDLETRKEIWRTTMPAGMLTSKLYQSKEYLFFACEDEIIYKISKNNGEIVWQCPIAGTPSRLFISKNNLYIIGGSNGILYIIDSITGATLSKQSITGENKSNNRFLRRTFIVGDESIVLNDGENWLCYPIEEDLLLKI